MRCINNSIYIYTETLLYILYNLGDDGDGDVMTLPVKPESKEILTEFQFLTLLTASLVFYFYQKRKDGNKLQSTILMILMMNLQ